MIAVKQITGLFKKISLLLVTVIIIQLTGLYIQCNIYTFPSASPFTGNTLYNPYANVASAAWLKANFHAHSIAWNHLTNGHQQPTEILKAYKRLKYDIASISNYHELVPATDSFIQQVPVYEHGYNMSKTHQLVFGPTRTNFFDLPFFQTTSTKQSVINALADESSCIALNHPLIRDGYTDADLQQLSGYQLVEVLNHSANSVAKWDTILSAGKAVWSLGNDDTHNINDSGEVGVCWTMISKAATNNDVIDQLKKGASYIVRGKDGFAENSLESLVVTGDSLLTLKLTNKANTIRLVGQHGQLKQTAEMADSITYVFSPEDTYIRAEIINNNTLIYLNPVIRYNGQKTSFNHLSASVNVTATALYRFAILFFSTGALALLYRKPILALQAELVKRRKRYKRRPGYSLGST